MCRCADLGRIEIDHARAPSTPSVRIAPEQTVPDAADGERKTVTALFADIKGSTELERPSRLLALSQVAATVE